MEVLGVLVVSGVHPVEEIGVVGLKLLDILEQVVCLPLPDLNQLSLLLPMLNQLFNLIIPLLHHTNLLLLPILHLLQRLLQHSSMLNIIFALFSPDIQVPFQLMTMICSLLMLLLHLHHLLLQMVAQISFLYQLPSQSLHVSLKCL